MTESRGRYRKAERGGTYGIEQHSVQLSLTVWGTSNAVVWFLSVHLHVLRNMTLLISRLLPISPSHHSPSLASPADRGSSHTLRGRGIRRSRRRSKGTYLRIDRVVVGRNSFDSGTA